MTIPLARQDAADLDQDPLIRPTDSHLQTKRKNATERSGDPDQTAALRQRPHQRPGSEGRARGFAVPTQITAVSLAGTLHIAIAPARESTDSICT